MAGAVCNIKEMRIAMLAISWKTVADQLHTYYESTDLHFVPSGKYGDDRSIRKSTISTKSSHINDIGLV